MANYSYGGLAVSVFADTRPLTRQVAAAAQSSGEQAAKSLAGTLGRGLASIGKTAAVGLGTGVGVLTAFGVASFKTAARVDEMNATLAALAKANHLSYPAVQQSVTAIRKQGIEAGVAQSTVAQFAQQHLDLAKSTDLSRVAQDAAVISGQNSSDTLQMLIHGISTQQTDVLRQAGIQVDANKAQADYAKQLHTSVAALTPAQKSQAMLNAVLTQGKGIAGAYAAAMEKPGKVLRSFPRLFNDIQVSVGTGLVDAFGPVIIGAYKFTHALDKALAPGGALAPVLTAIGKAAAGMVKPLTGMVGGWTKWVENLKPGQVTGIVNAIKDFAPQIAAIGAALGTFAGGKFSSQIPVIGNMLGDLGGPLGAVTAGLGVLVATSPEARDALGTLAKQLGAALGPVLKMLAPLLGTLAKALGPVLATVIRALTPVLVMLAKAFADVAGVFGGVIVDVLRQLVPVIMQLAPLLGIIGAALGKVLVSALNALMPLLPLVPVVLGAILDVLLPLIPLITLLATWLAKLAPILGPLILAWAALNLVMSLNPFGLVVLALAGVVTGIKLAYDHFAWFRTIVQSVFGWIAKNWPLLLGILTGGIGLAAVFIITHFTAVKSVVLGVVHAITGAVAVAWNWLAGVTSAIWGAISGAISGAWNAITGAVTAALTWLRNAVGSVFGAIRGITGAVWGYVSGTVARAWANIVAAATAALTWLRNTVSAVFGGIKAVTGAVWGYISGTVARAWSNIMAAATLALTWLRNTVSAVFGAIRGVAVAVWSFISGTLARAWANIMAAASAALTWLRDTTRNIWNTIFNTVKTIWGQIASHIAGIWGQITRAAGDAGKNVIEALKNGFVAAMKDIAKWVKVHIVDPIVNAVKHFFGIGGGGGGGGAPAPHAARSAGRQGGGGTVARAAQGGDDGGGSGNWIGGIGGMLQTMVHNVIEANPLDVAKHVFGSVAEALGWMVVKGMAAIESLGKTALSALMKIPGVSDALSWIGDVAGGIWGGIKGLFGGGGGGGVAGMVGRAMGFNGHRYVWGGGANSQAGFDCSSFVNMIAGMQGLPIPGGFHAPNSAHGPVTTNWLSFGALKTVPYNSMAPGDLYVNGHHMGIVTGPGRGFAARSTATGTGPQAVPRGMYTIRRFPGGGAKGGGVAGTSSTLAQALAGLLSQRAGYTPVKVGNSSQNLLTIARYMAGHGWSLPGAAGVSGNVYQESKGDPLSFGTGGRGLIGWTPPGRLPNSAFIPGNPGASMSRQLPLVDKFFRASMGRFWHVANQQSDPARAALVIMNLGERPAGSSQSNPFFGGTGTSRGSLRASVARQVFDQLKRSGGIRMATGGVLGEPVAGIGRYSGRTYQLAEAGPERVSPLLPGGGTAAERAMLAEVHATGRGRGTVVNVFPREHQSETAIAAAVSRELGWAAAGGANT